MVCGQHLLRDGEAVAHLWRGLLTTGAPPLSRQTSLKIFSFWLYLEASPPPIPLRRLYCLFPALYNLWFYSLIETCGLHPHPPNSHTIANMIPSRHKLPTSPRLLPQAEFQALLALSTRLLSQQVAVSAGSVPSPPKVKLKPLLPTCSEMGSHCIFQDRPLFFLRFLFIYILVRVCHASRPEADIESRSLEVAAGPLQWMLEPDCGHG